MSDQPNPRSSLANAVQAEMAALELRCESLQDRCTELDKLCALHEQERDQWQRRALDAEATRDHYGHYCVELISRLGNMKELGQLMAKVAEDLVNTAKRAAHKSSGMPAQEVILGEEDQERLKRIAETFGYGRPGGATDKPK